jgi:hypothetical protein
MAFQFTISRFFTRKRFAILAACTIIPALGIFLVTLKEETVRSLTLGQRLALAGMGAAFGVLVFAALETRRWLLLTIRQRRMNQQNASSLEFLKLALYLGLFAMLFLTILVVVIVVP